MFVVDILHYTHIHLWHTTLHCIALLTLYNERSTNSMWSVLGERWKESDRNIENNIWKNGFAFDLQSHN